MPERVPPAAAAHPRADAAVGSPNSESRTRWSGYLPPIEGLDADYLIENEYAPENLRSAVLGDDVISKGLRFEPLPVKADRFWEETWSKFTAG